MNGRARARMLLFLLFPAGAGSVSLRLEMSSSCCVEGFNARSSSNSDAIGKAQGPLLSPPSMPLFLALSSDGETMLFSISTTTTQNATSSVSHQQRLGVRWRNEVRGQPSALLLLACCALGCLVHCCASAGSYRFEKARTNGKGEQRSCSRRIVDLVWWGGSLVRPMDGGRRG